MVERRRRHVLKAITGAGALALGGIGTAAARKGKRKRKGASAEKNLVETAIALNESGPYAGAFDELIAAVVSADLVDALSASDVQLTVFAPVDAGFENVYAADNGIDEASDVPAGVLLYHVTRGRRYASSVLGAPRLRMLTGEFVTQADGTLNGGQGEIFVTDVEASNGVIHAIRPGDPGVLLP